jgi:hypothetical protein
MSVGIPAHIHSAHPAAAGGIFMPIIKSLSQAAGSEPNEPSRLKMGAFLTQVQCNSLPWAWPCLQGQLPLPVSFQSGQQQEDQRQILPKHGSRA